MSRLEIKVTDNMKWNVETNGVIELLAIESNGVYNINDICKTINSKGHKITY